MHIFNNLHLVCGLPKEMCPRSNGEITQRRNHTMTKTASAQYATENIDIRPFHVNVPEAELTELRRRINATKWPERETVSDATQGVQLATIQALARYWATDYDWRKVEARLNAL